MIKFCPKCGKEVSTKFCPFCGCDLSQFFTEDNSTPANPEMPEAPASPEISFESAESETPEEPPVISFETPEPAQEDASPDFSFDPEPEIKTEPQTQFSTYTTPDQDQTQTYNTYYIPPESQKESVTGKTWFIILMLLLFWPLGLFFMWRAKKFSKVARIIITAVIGVLFILNIIGTIALLNAADDYSYDDDYYDYSSDYLVDDYDSDYSSNDDYGSILGDSALDTAKSYLNSLYFSREGLIEQLEYEGFSTSEATAAVDSLIVDWNVQAAGCARNYLRTFPDWNRSEMIDQLEYEGFTYSQAAYGADAVGL